MCPVCAWLIKEEKMIMLHESACKKGSKDSFFKEKRSCDAKRSASNASAQTFIVEIANAT